MQRVNAATYYICMVIDLWLSISIQFIRVVPFSQSEKSTLNMWSRFDMHAKYNVKCKYGHIMYEFKCI